MAITQKQFLERQRSSAGQSSAGSASDIINKELQSRNLSTQEQKPTFLQSLVDVLNPFSEENKQRAENFSAAIKKLGDVESMTEEERQAIQDVGTGIGVSSVGPRFVEAGQKAATGLVSRFKNIFSRETKEVKTKTGAGGFIKTETEKVAEKIAPKMTKNEIKTALSEGRVVRTGKIQRLLGKSDEVVTSKRVDDAAETIVRRIEGAAKLSDQEIATAAQKEIASISRKLEPKLKEVKLGEEVKNDILNSWADIKESQLADSVFNTEGAIAKQQKRFEDILLESIDADNADDLWKLIQKYDDSVKRSIKEATAQSSDSAQELKDIWLTNRRILRDSLDDIAKNIEDTNVSSDFIDMTNLYTARQNIVNAANFTKGDMEFLRQLILKGAIAGGLGTAVGTLGFKLID